MTRAKALAAAGVLSLVLIGAPPACAAAQPSVHWDESKLSQPEYGVLSEHLVPVRMRDGTLLSTDIYRPDAPGRFPALLWRTPYSNYGGGFKDIKWFAQRGYVVVVQDVRGKYDSGGTYTLFRNEADDGYDTDEWIAAQPWSNGRIGTAGASYGGYTQIAQGVRNSTHLTEMSAWVTTGDVFNNWIYNDGALFLAFALPWGAVGMDGRVYQDGTGYDWPAIYRHLPLATIDQAAGHANPGFRELLRHPRANDPFWNDISFEKQMSHIGVPFLVVSGWYDLFLRGALRDHVAIREHGASERARRNKRLVIGPWAHTVGIRNNTPGWETTGPDRSIDFGPAAELDMRKLDLRWHDHWLKGIDNGVDGDPPIRIFVMGENYWRDENEWPLARTRYTKFYIGSGGRANGAAGDGTLSTAPPSGAAADSYTYDPASPVPTLSGSTCCGVVPFGPWDQRKAEMRSDVLVYTSPVLEQALEVTGPIVMKLYASTSAQDTDWTATLVDVHPDGYAQNIQAGIVRARYRNGTQAPASLLEPGKVYEYTIDLWATSNIFLPGHRLRLEISSSNFPRFDRNLNTGEDPATGTRMQPAQQRIHHSAKYPSHLVLPVIPHPPAP